MGDDVFVADDDKTDWTEKNKVPKLFHNLVTNR